MEQQRKIQFIITDDEENKNYLVSLNDKMIRFGLVNGSNDITIMHYLFLGISMELSKGYFQFEPLILGKELDPKIIEKGKGIVDKLNIFVTKIYDKEFKDKVLSKSKETIEA